MKRREFLSTFGKSAVITGAVNAVGTASMHAGTMAVPYQSSLYSGSETYERDYLENTVERYLEALISGNPKRAPFSADALFSENNQRLPLGEASWKTIDRLGRYRHYYADPETGRVGLIANIYENGTGCILVLRLIVKDHLICDVEQFVIRDRFGSELYERMGQPDPVWLEPIPRAQQQSREALEAVSYMYFQALERNDGSGIYPFMDNCERLEHARRTVNRPTNEGYGHAETSVDFVTLSAKEQYELGMMAFVTRIVDRRAAVVDIERGAVLGQSCYEFDGTLKTIHFDNGDTWDIPPYFRTPRTHQAIEGFKIINGSFRYIEMTFLEVPFGTRQASPGRPMTVSLDFAPVRTASKPVAAGDRVELISITEEVLDALKECCPYNLPLAENFRYTENGITVSPGEGLWKTVVDMREYGVFLADPHTGQAGWFGALDEYGRFTMLALRMKLENGLISEIETVIARPERRRQGDEFNRDVSTMFMAPLLIDLDPDGFARPDPALTRHVDAVSEKELTGAVDKYFRAFTSRDGSLASLAPDCIRRENGVRTCRNPEGLSVDASNPEFHLYTRDCGGELDVGFISSLNQLRSHRTLIADDSQGLVLDLALMDNPAVRKTVRVAGSGDVQVPSLFLAPWTDLHAQLFKIESGAVTYIEGLVRRVPYGQSSGWEVVSG
ncbi:MAG: hypothetical protein P8Z37_07705, partial [Acidobacteriota bacterium]